MIIYDSVSDIIWCSCSTPARRELQAGLTRAASDPACRSVVLCGAGGMFVGSGDIKEFQNGSAYQGQF